MSMDLLLALALVSGAFTFVGLTFITTCLIVAYFRMRKFAELEDEET